MVIVLIKFWNKRSERQNEAVPVFCTCSSLLACSRMDLMASSEPVSVVRIRVVILPEEENKTNDTGKTFICLFVCYFKTQMQAVYTNVLPHELTAAHIKPLPTSTTPRTPLTQQRKKSSLHESCPPAALNDESSNITRGRAMCHTAFSNITHTSRYF